MRGWGVDRKRVRVALFAVLFLFVNHVNYYLLKTKNKLRVCKIAFQWQFSICPRAGNSSPDIYHLLFGLLATAC